MANEYRKITLTELGGNAGPNYSVEYSTDCVTYLPSVDCTNVVLGSVGSHVYCTVDDASTCIRLTSLGGVCDNSVIESFGPTTSTTTLQPTTSTTSGPTTTTVGPTTSTTTQAPITYWSASYCVDDTPVPVCLRFTSSVSVGQVGNFNSLDPATCFYLTGQHASPCGFYFSINYLFDSCETCAPPTTTTTTCPVLFEYASVLSEGNGTAGPTALTNCCATPIYSFYSTRSSWSTIQAGDIIYSTPCVPWVGGSKYYGIGDVGDILSTQHILQIDNNGVVLGVVLCTPCPTTTTTAVPTTTVSPTTTAAPTSTTTTVSCPECFEYEIANNSQVPGDTVNYYYFDCVSKTYQTGFVTYDSSVTICACSTPVRTSGPIPVITELGYCNGTTTTLSPTTSTTTTTLSPTGCYEWTLTCNPGNPGGCNVNYTDCNGTAQSITVPDDTEGVICARPTPSSTTAIITQSGVCAYTTTTTVLPTTSTTLAPSTTTVSPTTTAAPTTTTTTFACLTCDEYEIANNSQVPGDTVTVQYIDCTSKTLTTAQVPYDSSGFVCSCNTPIRISGPTPVITNTGICPGYTTTTVGPTTSTTLSPTTSTTLAPTTLAPTTSTTTQAAGTTTTTVSCTNCDEYEIANNSQTPGDTATYYYFDCDTQQYAEGSVTYDSSVFICSCSTPVRISGPALVITNLGECLLPLTTTTTTVAATTLAPSTSTTTLGQTTTTTNCPATIYTHGAVRGTCSDYCTTNYLIQTLTCADNDYASLTIGDTIYGYTSAGYVAYSNTSTDTNTGPFKIAEIDSNGMVIDILVCSGNACVPL